LWKRKHSAKLIDGLGVIFMSRILVTFGIAAGLSLTAPVMANEAMRCVQQILNDYGYAAGPVDGAIGNRTRQASVLAASDIGLTLSELTPDTAGQWCTALTGFSGTPDGKLLQSPARAVLPGDILLQMPKITTGPGAEYCAAADNRQNQSYLAMDPVERISGFSSRMSNIMSVAHARPLEDFAGAFGGSATLAFASNDTDKQTELVRLLAKWANADALLATESCVNRDGYLINTGICTEWTKPDGSDLSAMKDATFVTFLGVGMIRAYYATLADVATDELAAEHKAISSWISAWAKRLKRPGDVYFGLGMGWYWPAITNDLAAGRRDAARAKLNTVATELVGLIDDDGSMPYRTTRGNRALWYHFTGLNEVVLTMELMRAAGLTPSTALEEKLHKTVALFNAAVQDHSILDPWARIAHNAIYDGTQDWHTQTWMNAGFAGTWLQVYPYRYAGLETAEELRRLVGPKAGSGVFDIDIGLPMGCIYEAASSLRGYGTASN
jgi:hypothetical protein